jgi:hypothetical protein
MSIMTTFCVAQFYSSTVALRCTECGAISIAATLQSLNTNSYRYIPIKLRTAPPYRLICRPSPNISVDFQPSHPILINISSHVPPLSPHLVGAVKSSLPTPDMFGLLTLPLSPIALSLASSRKLITGRGHARRELQREGVHTGVPHEDDNRHELTPHAKSHHLLRLLGIAIVEGVYPRAEEVGRDEAPYRHEGFGLELFFFPSFCHCRR